MNTDIKNRRDSDQIVRFVLENLLYLSYRYKIQAKIEARFKAALVTQAESQYNFCSKGYKCCLEREQN